MHRCSSLIVLALACTPTAASAPPATPGGEEQPLAEKPPAEAPPTDEPATDEPATDEPAAEAPPAQEHPLEEPKPKVPASGTPCTVWTGGPRGDAKPPAGFAETTCPDGEQCNCDRAGGYSCSGHCG